MWKLINNPTPSDLQQCRFEEMFCQRDATYEYPSPSKLPAHSQKKSSTPERASMNCIKPSDTQNQAIFVDKYLDLQSPEQEDGEDGSSENRVEFLKTQRHRLEKDVVGLQDKLQQEIELHYALENACRQEASLITNYPNLPEHAQELVADVAMLEMAISHLEEQIASLNIQLCDEQRERQKAESSSMIKLPSLQIPQTQESTFRDTHSSDYSSTPNSCSNPISPRVYKLPHPSENALLINNNPRGEFESPINQTFCPTDDQTEFIAHSGSLGCKHFWQKHTFFSPEKLKSKPCESLTATSCGNTKNKLEVIDLKDSWLHPNKLSQEMVNCMVSIYQHLADPMETNPIVKRTSSSPTSPYGIVTGSSVSSISEESSFVSFARSPSMDSQRKDIGSSDRSFDPYKTNEKLPWSDIGNYSTAIEVSEMLVGKEQLDYAAEALRMFRSLVEQLSRVDPSTMKHDEKLAFWINVYNALMMHAYLAYGVPKNDFKFFSLMQKAAYTVGGHSFNAVVIEHLLLKAKAQWYRPQIALLLAHQKLKLRDEVSMFAIDHTEPLVTFSLSFGASSSPAIRVYTAGNVHDELESALQDYARASVGVNARGKVLIPKLLFDFACDIVEESEIPEWICQFLPCQQSSLIRNCIKHRQHRFLNSKHLSVVPFDFRFRYLFLLAYKQQSIHPVKL